MYKRLFLVASLSLLLAACGGSSSNSDNDNSGTDNSGTDNSGTDNSGTDNSGTDNSGTDNSGTDNSGTSDVAGLEYKCAATVASDADYTDSFIEQRKPDRDWGENEDNAFQVLYTDFTVEQIAGEFNAARADDPTINEKLKMPEQAVWDNMSPSAKALYLVNSERCARGILPFQGILPALNDSAQSYAAVIAESKELTHGPEGSSLARIVAAGGTEDVTDFTSKSESLAMYQISTTEFVSLHEPEARAVYDWLYDDIEDQSTGYGHRQHVLLNKYQNKSSEIASEGLFGMATEVSNYTENGMSYSESWVVMHSFDPNDQFTSMATVTAAPALMGPETGDDCLGDSVFTSSKDDDGKNTSTCEAPVESSGG